MAHFEPGLEMEALEKAVRDADPAAVLAAPWLMRQVICADRNLRGPLISVPHSRCYAIACGRLMAIVDEQNLPFTPDRPLEPVVLLVARPDAEWLGDTPVIDALVWFWRMLFHARVDAAMRQRLESCSAAEIEQRIAAIGRSAFAEAKFVLQKDRYLPHDADERAAYVEFASVFLEMYHFNRPLLGHVFPAINDADAAIAVLRGDIDDVAILEQTRLPGAPDRPGAFERGSGRREAAAAPVRRRVSARRRKALERRAAYEEDRGNVSRAAVLRMSACRGDEQETDRVRAHAIRDLEQLVERLQAAVGFDPAHIAEWRNALEPLLAHAAGGWWNPERRLLYDLQKVCTDHEREIYAIRPFEWLFSLGRKPLRRSLPAQRRVLICKHLRSALHRLVRVRVEASQRQRLEHLLREAVHSAEHRLRDALRAPVAKAVREGGLSAHGAAEEVAFEKLIEEMLDLIVRRGHMAMGDVRDAIARNQVKLDDLTLAEFFRGDQLLRIDRRLADSMPGIYRRGEVYLRFFQRLMSLLFGNPPGRVLTRFVLAPLGGAYLVLAALDHTLGDEVLDVAFRHDVPLVTRWTIAGVSLFLLGVFQWPAFRRMMWRATRALGRGIRGVFYDGPRWVATRPVVQAFFRSAAMRLAWRYVLKPGIATAIVWLVITRRMHPENSAVLAAGVFVVLNLLLNSRAGRLIEQNAAHALGVLWARLTGDILMALLRLIVRAFEHLLDQIDRLLYAVDEWLRFRAGQGSSALVFKGALGMAWFAVMYVVRFVVNLLVEPQVNPLKHFPVVTVSHKLILPLAVPAGAGRASPLGEMLLSVAPIGVGRANTIAASIVWGIPGIFGFLAWELKENWRLYRANRSRTLRPVRVGSHGETMAQLLRPGLHSGTLPKLFARLRKAERRVASRRASTHARKQIEHLQHVREAVANFIERELLAVLNEHPSWEQLPLSLGELKLGATRIVVEIRCADSAEGALWLSMEQRSGWILASIDRRGWAGRLEPAQADVLNFGLLGLCKMAGVDIVANRLKEAFAWPMEFDVRGDELIVWPQGRFEVCGRYNLNDEGPFTPRTDPAAADVQFPTLAREYVLLSAVPVTWEQWVKVWDAAAVVPRRGVEVGAGGSPNY